MRFCLFTNNKERIISIEHFDMLRQEDVDDINEVSFSQSINMIDGGQDVRFNCIEIFFT